MMENTHIEYIPEAIVRQARQQLLAELREKWAWEAAQGHPVFSLKLDDWIAFCKEAGITEDWWELK